MLAAQGFGLGALLGVVQVEAPGEYDSLHYLDDATGHLITCRGLLAVHPPQGYTAELQDHALEEVRILPRTGEFVHPGEAERLQALQEEARRAALEAERVRRALREAEARRMARWVAKVQVSRVKAPVPARPQAAMDPRPEPEVSVAAPGVLWGGPVAAVPREAPVYTCRLCGRQTRDWVVRYGNTGECKCRACARGMG